MDDLCSVYRLLRSELYPRNIVQAERILVSHIQEISGFLCRPKIHYRVHNSRHTGTQQVKRMESISQAPLTLPFIASQRHGNPAF